MQENNALPGIERVQALTNISHLGHVVIAMKSVHRLQSHPILQN